MVRGPERRLQWSRCTGAVGSGRGGHLRALARDRVPGSVPEQHKAFAGPRAPSFSMQTGLWVEVVVFQQP